MLETVVEKKRRKRSNDGVETDDINKHRNYLKDDSDIRSII